MIRDLTGLCVSWEMPACFYPPVELDELRVLDGCSEYLHSLRLSLIWRVPCFLRQSLFDGLLHCCEEPDVRASSFFAWVVCYQLAENSACVLHFFHDAALFWKEQRAIRGRLQVPHARLELHGELHVELHLGDQVLHFCIRRVSFCFRLGRTILSSLRLSSILCEMDLSTKSARVCSAVRWKFRSRLENLVTSMTPILFTDPQKFAPRGQELGGRRSAQQSRRWIPF